MADIAIAWDPTTCKGDWSVSGGDLALDASLRTFVYVALFTDRVAPPDWRPPPGDVDPRGWWADTFTGTPIGSTLWTFMRAKKADNPAALLRAVEASAREALQLLLDRQIAASIDVAGRYASATLIRLDITITKPSGDQVALSVLGPWTGI